MDILQSFGRGCAFLDYDGDGWMDILLVASPHPVLYRNLHDGHFQNVTASTRLDRVSGDWRGCAVGDVDGDGRPDLLLTGYHALALLSNEAGGWRDITAAAGLDPRGGNEWASSAGFMDLDRDGDLDLVLLHYVVFRPGTQRFCQWKPGLRSGCGPSVYQPEFSQLWRNTGRGHFQDQTKESGLYRTSAKGMVLAFGDPNGDGFPDFFVGNDGRPSDLMLSEGGLRFRNAAEESGVAYGSIDGEPISAMSADWGDYDRDGRPDLFVTAFSNQPYSLLRATDAGKFVHMGDATGITAATFKPLGFGAKWLDMDNDGWLDLAVANGHVHDNTEQIDPTTAYREPMMLLRNDRGRRFVDLLDKMEAAVRLPIVGRGLATGDFDNDGRVDVLVVDYEGKPLLLHNEDRNANHWITLSLIGARNRTAYGARVTARAGDQVWTGMVSPASSFLSSSDPRLHFGLASVSTLDSVTVEWPSGWRQELARVATDRFLELREPTQPGKDGDR